jgi:hypothetical protein
LAEAARICDRQNLRVIARWFDGDGSNHCYHVDITQHAREIMARLGHICTELSDREPEDEEEMTTGDDDRGGLSWNRGEDASGFESLITGQVGEETSMTYDIYPDKMLFDEFEGFLAICDPSHLEKRARYHLIKGCVCDGFSESCEPLSLIELPELLNLPRIVFSDLQITKMKEKPPWKLDAVNNIHFCLRYGLIRILLYSFPLYLVDTAIFEERICRSDRLMLLKSCSIYFIMIRDWLDQTDEARALPQRRGKCHPRIALWNRIELF